jgi:prepilin peptidase dependent protein B
MPVKQQGFSLTEVLIAMAISSILMLATVRFLPSLQSAAYRQTQQQALEEDLWQRLFTLARHVQRAGFCRGNCGGEGLVIGQQCFLSRWDSNLNGRWEEAPTSVAEVTGFRLQDGVLETLRGATSCTGKGWEKMTDPNVTVVDSFVVHRRNIARFAPEFTIELTAHVKARPEIRVSARYGATGHNL